MYRWLAILAASAFLCGCGNNLGKSPKKSPNGDPNNANGATNGGTGTTGDAECGNGTLEPGELCDGDCPTSCTTGDACATVTLVGSPEQCNAQCLTEQISACQAGDSCCPDGCTPDDDSDCSETCGNGTVDPGELCDGDCPAECNDGMACTRDIFSGSASTCTAQCTYETITACQGGDGCCPDGCTEANDSDCSCVPTTCQAEGAECGTIDDGCSSTIMCPDTCGDDETCEGNTCVPGANDGEVGDACASDADCGNYPNRTCVEHPDYKDGYCSAPCEFDNDCPMGSHCARLFVGDPDAEKVCMKNCTDDTDCRDDGYACHNWDSFDDQAQLSDECAPVADGSGEIGDPCAGLYECKSGYECTREWQNQDSSVTTFPDGSCTQGCVPLLSPCSDPDAVCPDMTPLCMPSCTTSSDCRMGYECISSQFEMRDHCWPM